MKKLKKGDTISIVSLSSGVLGESFVSHEVKLGLQRLKQFGLNVVFAPNALKGMDYIKNNPEARAQDLIWAFKQQNVNAIICAIGGDDAHLVTPFLKNEKFAKIVQENEKIFLGYSDSTTNHLLLNGLGLKTFYGQSFLSDLCELGEQMLPYSEKAFLSLFSNQLGRKIELSDVWYKERENYSENQVGINLVGIKESKGYISLGKRAKAQGKLIGGCIEVLNREIKLLETDASALPKNVESFKGCVLLLETSEQKIAPTEYKVMLEQIEKYGLFNVACGVVLSKPQNEQYLTEYYDIAKQVLAKYNFPILANVNIGHSLPHSILPLNNLIEVDGENKTLTIAEEVFN